jgi:anti-sigma factor RsiW
MMACAAWDSSLDRYLDGELPDAEIAALEAHLSGCAPCAAEALRRREFQLGIREAGAELRASPAFRARIERTVRRGWPDARATLRLLPLAAALLVAAGLLALRGARSPAGDLGLREAVDLHVTALASTVPLDVLSSDSHTVKPWFEGKLPFTFDLPDFSGSPFELLGGRVVYLDQAPAAQLLLRMRRHRISVFVLKEREGLADKTPREATRSFRVTSFADRGLRFIAVADTGPEELEELARRLRPISL